MSEPIELISTEDMSQELANRFDAIVICAIKYTKEEQSHMYKAWHGNNYTCLGLAEFVKYEIFKKENSRFAQMKEEEEK